eukprot:Em0010g310a
MEVESSARAKRQWGKQEMEPGECKRGSKNKRMPERICLGKGGLEGVLPPGRKESCRRGGESPAAGEERVLPLGRKESCCRGGKSPAAGEERVLPPGRKKSCRLRGKSPAAWERKSASRPTRGKERGSMGRKENRMPESNNCGWISFWSVEILRLKTISVGAALFNLSVPNAIITACNVTCGPSSLLNTNSSSMSLQWNAPLQPDYVITAYTLHHRVPSLKSQSEMWAPPSTATVQFHTYNPSGILLYQINSVMTDILEVKLHGGLPWLMFAQCGLWTSCRWIQQYQNLQRWSVAHWVFEQASNTFYVTVDTVHAAAITAVIVPLLTMKVYFEGFPSTSSRYGIATPYSMSPDEFDAVSVQNVGSTYIIVSWDLPTDSNGIHINFSLYCNGALAGVLPLTVISYNTTGLLPFTLYMYITLSVGQVLQSHPQALHSNWNVVLGVISAAASLPRPYGGAYSRSPIPQLEQDVVVPGHKEHEEPLAVSIPSHHWMENYSSLGSKFSQD